MSEKMAKAQEDVEKAKRALARVCVTEAQTRLAKARDMHEAMRAELRAIAGLPAEGVYREVARNILDDTVEVSGEFNRLNIFIVNLLQGSLEPGETSDEG